MPQISVIVPVYKVEQYIHRCVNSILKQTHADFELILVDDGSPDHCGTICDEYAQKDNRIHVIHQKNGGLSAARNAGIDWAFANSDSQWVTFIDSDDWVHPQMLEQLLRAALENETSVSVCGYAETSGDEPVVMPDVLKPQIWKTEEFFLQSFTNAIIAWGKLYRKECFREIRYPVGKVHEDEYTTYRILFSYPQIAVIPAPLYAYYINPAGITKSVQTIKRYDVIQAYDDQISFFLKERFMNLLEKRVPICLNDADALLRWIENSPESSKYQVQKKDIEQKIARWLDVAWKYKWIDFWQYYGLLWKFYPARVILYRAKLIIEKRIRRIKNAFH